MSDIFISYAREDQPIAEKLSTALTSMGWSVWWDRRIRAGAIFDEVIAKEISAARCVVVLWSRHSVNSRWVKLEARQGATRRILVPVRIDEIELPFEFADIQTVGLIGWRGQNSHSGFGSLIEGLSEILGSPRKPRIVDAPSRDLEPARRSELRKSISERRRQRFAEGWWPTVMVGSSLERVKHHWKLAGSVCGGALLAGIGVTLFMATAEIVPDPKPPQDPSLRRVRITSFGDTYEIYRNNEKLGETPYEFYELPGTHVEIDCRRNGRSKQPLEFDVGRTNANNYSCKG